MRSSCLTAQYPVLNWWALASRHQSHGIYNIDARRSGPRLLFRHPRRNAVGQVVSFTGFATLLIGRLDQLSAFVNQIFAARAKLEDFFEMEASAAYAVEPKTRA